MSMYSVGQCCWKHPDIAISFMNVGSFRVPYCWKCHNPKPKFKKSEATTPQTDEDKIITKNIRDDFKIVKKNSWDGKEKLKIDPRASRRRIIINEKAKKIVQRLNNGEKHQQKIAMRMLVTFESKYGKLKTVSEETRERAYKISGKKFNQ